MLGRQGRCGGHDLGDGCGRPVTGMGLLMPFLHALVQLGTKMICGCKIHHAQAFALEDTAPRFHWMHPGALHRGNVHDNAWMLREPHADLLAMRRTDMVAHQLKRADGLIDCPIHRFKKGDAFPWSFTVSTVPIDLARTGIKGGHEMQRPGPLVLLRHVVGPVVGLRWEGRGKSGPRWPRGLLVHREAYRIRPEGTGVEVNQVGDGGTAGSVPRGFGVPPQMLTPGLQLRRGQHPPHRRGRDVLHDPLGAELPRQLVTIPRREAAAQEIGALAGQAHDVDRHLRGKNRPWRRGQGRLKDRPDAGREPAGPSGGPRCVARRRPAPPPMGRTRPPGAGSSSPAGPVLPQWWSTVATVPASDARRGPAQGVTQTCGHVPWQSPPSCAMSAGEDIPAGTLQVKPIGIVVHDELY